ncbi:Oidioi.mRNA.OKI2018_I69.chr1.g1048.t1.cds [Oikopleura dioica]|uniref:Oidioi.mRNA.OKI2018_I69.chr1.g1048.t1.cds n=1 Tax=Oikopleura dioica TaxID=34765 RepID=A0ABN7ST46_OIKDI|nr:Oidioi.mRNA.OKI2018_I69.chr1.g1048.t1.cds [Oikopleura dioica]
MTENGETTAMSETCKAQETAMNTVKADCKTQGLLATKTTWEAAVKTNNCDLTWPCGTEFCDHLKENTKKEKFCDNWEKNSKDWIKKNTDNECKIELPCSAANAQFPSMILFILAFFFFIKK